MLIMGVALAIEPGVLGRRRCHGHAALRVRHALPLELFALIVKRYEDDSAEYPRRLIESVCYSKGIYCLMAPKRGCGAPTATERR